MMRNREAGYMAKIVSAFVSASPSKVYKYLAANASKIIADLAKNMMHCGTLDVIRFLLDVPLESRLLRCRVTCRWKAVVGREQHADRSLRQLSGGPGYGVLRVLLLRLRDPARHGLCVRDHHHVDRSQAEPERATVQLLPYLLSTSVVEKLLQIAFNAEDQYVAYNVFAILSRVFWTKLPSGAK